MIITTISICRECQSVTDVACKSDAPCLHVDDQHGFEIDEAEIVFWGTCPSCSPSPNNQKRRERMSEARCPVAHGANSNKEKGNVDWWPKI